MGPLIKVIGQISVAVLMLFAVRTSIAETLLTRTEAGEIRVTPRKDFYAVGEEVELELDLATFPSPIPTTNGPTALQRFVGWSGDASGTENPLRVVMDRSKVIEAIVEPAYPMEQRETWGATPTVAADGTVYLTSDLMLYALTPDLQIKWAVTNIGLAGDPVIGPSGNIFVVAENGNATCVSPTGQELWRYISDDPYTYGPSFIQWWPRTPLITSNETLYYLSGSSPLRGGLKQLYIVKEGKLVQRIDNPPSGLLAGPDDTFYVGKGTGFEAHKPFGTVKWSSPYPLPVVIDGNGRLYSVGAGTNIVALDFQGQHLWTREVSDWAGRLQIGGGGRLFVRRNGGISVFDTNGVTLWERASADVLPLKDGGALVLDYKFVHTTTFYGEGSYIWAIFRRIHPDGKAGEFSTYFTGLSIWRKSEVSCTLTSITDAGDVYGYWTYTGGGLAGWVKTSLFHWKSGAARQGERQIDLARSESGWVLRKRGIPGSVAVESSTNLRDWEAMGEMDTELSIAPADGSPRFYRLRVE